MKKINIGRAATDPKCQYRKCFSIMQNQGTYTPKVGYTSYYKDERWGCKQNMLHGCPDNADLELDFSKVVQELRHLQTQVRWNKRKILFLTSLLEDLYTAVKHKQPTE